MLSSPTAAHAVRSTRRDDAALNVADAFALPSVTTRSAYGGFACRAHAERTRAGQRGRPVLSHHQLLCSMSLGLMLVAV